MATIEEKAGVLDEIHERLLDEGISWQVQDKINLAEWIDRTIAELYYDN